MSFKKTIFGLITAVFAAVMFVNVSGVGSHQASAATVSSRIYNGTKDVGGNFTLKNGKTYFHVTPHKGSGTGYLKIDDSHFIGTDTTVAQLSESSYSPGTYEASFYASATSDGYTPNHYYMVWYGDTEGSTARLTVTTTKM